MEGTRLVEWLKAERTMQDGRVAPLPRVTRTLIPTPPLRSALTAVYGSERSITGLLMVFRTAEQPAFGALDEAILQSSLESGSDVLERLRVFDGEQTARERANQRTLPAQFVLGEDLTIEYSWLPPGAAGDDVIRTVLSTAGERLPLVVENAVRAIVASWEPTRGSGFGIAIPLPFMLVRAVELQSADGGSVRYSVTVERFRSRNAMSWAARHFHMSPRELQILALILQGLGTVEIAEILHIAGSTAHDHVKRMLLKTKARNRVEMVAKVLGWRAVG